MAMASCSQSASTVSEEEAGPETLVEKISQSIKKGEYSLAIELIDSLNNNYPDEIELRKTTLLSRAQAMEGLIRDSIPVVDEEIVRTQLEMDSLKTFFDAVQEKSLPGYVVDKKIKNLSLTSGTKIQPRLGDSSSPWILAVSIPGHKNITGIAFTKNGEESAIYAKDPSSRRVKGTTNEMISFMADEAKPLATYLASEPKESISVRIITEKGDVPVKLSDDVRNAIVRTYQYAELREENRKAKLHRELLDRKLVAAQNQIANFENKK